MFLLNMLIKLKDTFIKLSLKKKEFKILKDLIKECKNVKVVNIKYENVLNENVFHEDEDI